VYQQQATALLHTSVALPNLKITNATMKIVIGDSTPKDSRHDGHHHTTGVPPYPLREACTIAGEKAGKGSGVSCFYVIFIINYVKVIIIIY